MMKLFFTSLLLSTLVFTASAQKINGQWRGFFNSNGDIVLSGNGNTEYVLEIEINGTKITGFSYSYFQDRQYYVICSLSGTYYKSTKSMTVTETARIKGLTPPNWNDCLQTHILSYEKNGTVEELKGRWRTAPGQVGDCGIGNTTLTRRTLNKDLSSFNKPKAAVPFSAPKTPARRLPDLSDKNKKPANRTTPPVAKQNSAPKAPVAPLPPVIKANPEKDNSEAIVKQFKKLPDAPILVDGRFEKRNNEVVKTIEIANETFNVDLYDNGDIDGDSISVFYNHSLLISHKRLSDKAITLTLTASPDVEINELTMYAENLGEIPPNTALMVVTDGDKRYEVRISSDLKKSGTIRFVRKPE